MLINFSLGGNYGLKIFAAGYPQTGRIPCGASDPVTDLQATSPSASTLIYKAGVDRYHYDVEDEGRLEGHLPRPHPAPERRHRAPGELQVQVGTSAPRRPCFAQDGGVPLDYAPPEMGERPGPRPEAVNPQLGLLAGRSLFTVAGRIYAWEDVLLAAELRGELVELERQARRGLASVRRLEAEQDALPPEALHAAATAFRYAHNLLAAEELEAWLDTRGLSVSDWNGYLRRLVLRERWEDELERIESEFAVGDDEVEEVLTAEALCSGFLRRAAERLAEDAALAASDLEADDSGDRASLLAALTRAAQAVRSRPPAPADVAREIAAQTLDWIRIEAETLELPDADAAREAALLVRVDGRTLSDVAEECGVPANALTLYLADAQPQLQARLVSASPGELIGPLDQGGGHLLLQLVAKVEPSAEDPELGRRAAAVLATRTVERELRDRVLWHERP